MSRTEIRNAAARLAPYLTGEVKVEGVKVTARLTRWEIRNEGRTVYECGSREECRKILKAAK